MTGTPKLAAALAKVQANLPKLERDRTVTVQTKSGEPYSYSYATLANLSEAVLPLLAEHGLAFTAFPGTGSDGKLRLCYSLLHESGEALSGEFPIAAEGGIQTIGGRITYARRYCLAAVVGIAADEDDESRLANEAPPHTAQRSGHRPSSQDGAGVAQRSAPQARPASQPPLPGEEVRVSPEQLKKVQALFTKVGWAEREDRLRAASAIVGRPLATATQLTGAEASHLIDTLGPVASQADPAVALAELLADIRGEQPAAEDGEG